VLLKTKDAMEKKFILTQKIISYMLIAFAVLGVGVPLIMRQFNLSILGSYLALPMVLAPLAWMKCRQNKTLLISLNNDVFYVLSALFWSLCGISLLMLHIYEVRLLSYYILVGTMGLSVLLQILLFNKLSGMHTGIVLVQICSLLLNVIWGVGLKYEYFIGRTDILGHSWLIKNLTDYGHIGNVFDIYQPFPLWHILCSISTLISNNLFPIHKLMFLLNGITYVFIIIVIYLIVKFLACNKIALLSTLFACFNPELIIYGMYSIPRSVISFIEIFLIYLLLTRSKNPLNILIITVATFAIVIYHTASMPFVALILISFYIMQRVYKVGKSDSLVGFNYLLLAAVITLMYWIFYGQRIFRAVIVNLFTPAPSGILTKSIVYTPLSELFNYLQYTPLLFFVICGVLWILIAKKITPLAKIFFTLGIIFAFITFPGPALLLNKLMGNFNLDRFGEYSFLFICMAGAAGLYALFYKVAKLFKVLIVVSFFLMAFLSISNDFTASDNPLIKRPFYTFYLTKEETIALNRLALKTEGYIMSDYITCRYLESSSHADKVHLLEVNPEENNFLLNNSDDIILIRKGELSKRPLKLFTSTNGEFKTKPSWAASMDYYYIEHPLWEKLKFYNNIYDSNAVMAVTSAP